MMINRQEPLNPVGFMAEGRFEECMILAHVLRLQFEEKFEDREPDLPRSARYVFSPTLELDQEKRPFLVIGIGLIKSEDGWVSPDYDTTPSILEFLEGNAALQELGSILDVEFYVNEEKFFSVKPTFNGIDLEECPFDRETFTYVGARDALPSFGSEFGAELTNFRISLQSDSALRDDVLKRVGESLSPEVITAFRDSMK